MALLLNRKNKFRPEHYSPFFGSIFKIYFILLLHQCSEHKTMGPTHKNDIIKVILSLIKTIQIYVGNAPTIEPTHKKQYNKSNTLHNKSQYKQTIVCGRNKLQASDLILAADPAVNYVRMSQFYTVIKYCQFFL